MRLFPRSARLLSGYTPLCGSAALVVAMVVLSASRAEAAGNRLSFQKYLDLDEKARRRLVLRYVTKSGSYWKVLLDSYLIQTDMSAEKALGLAVRMDDFYGGFTRIFSGQLRIRKRPELYALKDRASYRRAASMWSHGRMIPPPWSGGMFATIGSNYAVFALASGDETRLYNVLFHEGTHHLMHFYIGRKIPRWFDEGAATNFEHWDVTLSPERNVSEVIWRSRWPAYLHKMMKDDRKPDLAKLMNTTVQQWTAAGGNPRPLYAQAWGIVNCLLTSGRSGQRNVNILIQAFRGGKGHRRGVSLLAPQTMAMLARQYDEYIKSVVVPHCEYGLPVAKLVASDKGDEAATRLKEGLGKFPKSNELLYFKGVLALKAGDAAGALAILKPLDKRYPRHPHLTGAIGRAAFESGDRMGAARWLRNALKENLRDKRVEELLEQLKQKPR